MYTYSTSKYIIRTTQEAGHKFSWIVRSRPDLRWHAERTRLPALHDLPQDAVYFAELVPGPKTVCTIMAVRIVGPS